MFKIPCTSLDRNFFTLTTKYNLFVQVTILSIAVEHFVLIIRLLSSLRHSTIHFKLPPVSPYHPPREACYCYSLRSDHEEKTSFQQSFLVTRSINHQRLCMQKHLQGKTYQPNIPLDLLYFPSSLSERSSTIKLRTIVLSSQQVKINLYTQQIQVRSHTTQLGQGQFLNFG